MPAVCAIGAVLKSAARRRRKKARPTRTQEPAPRAQGLCFFAFGLGERAPAGAARAGSLRKRSSSGYRPRGVPAASILSIRPFPGSSRNSGRPAPSLAGDCNTPMGVRNKALATPAGFEPAACGLGIRRSIRLSYGAETRHDLVRTHMRDGTRAGWDLRSCSVRRNSRRRPPCRLLARRDRLHEDATPGNAGPSTGAPPQNAFHRRQPTRPPRLVCREPVEPLARTARGGYGPFRPRGRDRRAGAMPAARRRRRSNRPGISQAKGPRGRESLESRSGKTRLLTDGASPRSGRSSQVPRQRGRGPARRGRHGLARGEP